MQISVSGHHIQITQSIEAYIHKKLSRLERHFQPILSSQVILDKMTKKLDRKIVEVKRKLISRRHVQTALTE